MASITSATFTPAASSHATPAVVGGAQQFLQAGQVGACVNIVSASLRIDNSSLETSTWQVHLYDLTPPSAIADAATFTLPSGDRASYLGAISLAQTVLFTNTQYIESNNIYKLVRLSHGGLYGYLVNGTTLTPAAVAHVVTLGIEMAF